MMRVFPLMGQSAWGVLAGQLARSFNGRSRLPLHEFDKAKVQTPRRRVRPLPTASGDVQFNAWRLAHALKKADCARWPSSQLLWVGAAGFLLEHVQLFDWSSGELRLNEGMSDFYADFSRTSLVGRIAQGVSLLFLEDQGYAYVGRFEAEWKRQGGGQGGGGKRKAPDFIVENESGERALAESKGSFVPVGGRPNIKGALNDALTQLDGWDRVITPPPAKSFAIGTFLREFGDTSTEGSLIAFVDPPPGPPMDPIEFSPDAIRRTNYASWLSLMGFDDVARRLRTKSGETQNYMVPVLTLTGKKYAVTIVSITPKFFRDFPTPEFWDDIWDWPYFFHHSFRDGIDIELVGLDLDVFNAVGDALRTSHAKKLMEMKPIEHRDIPGELDGGAFYGSVFSDGSLLGQLRLRRPGRSFIDWVEVQM